jgi:hypothetical protein
MELVSVKMIRINKHEVIKQIVLEKKFMFFKYKRAYREVHGEIFLYRKEKYLLCNDSKVRRYFKKSSSDKE